MGRNITGPPAAGRRVLPLVSHVAYASVTENDRRQRPLLVWPPTLYV